MEIKATTKKGSEVVLEIEKGKITVYLPSFDASFRATGWGSQPGYEDVVGVLGQIRIKGKSQPACITIPKEIWDKAEAEAKAQEDVLTSEAMGLNIVGFEYIMGCDAPSQYQFIYEENDLPFSYRYKRIEADQLIIKGIKALSNLQELAKEWGAESLPATGTSWGGYRFTRDQTQGLIALATAEQERRQKAEAEILVEEEARKAAIFAKAAETGEPQILETWVTDECTTKEYDCSFDIVTRYALPDGTTKTSYVHGH